MTYQIETNGKKLLLVEVNEEISRVKFHKWNDGKPVLVILSDEIIEDDKLPETDAQYLFLPEGNNYSLLGTITDNKEIDFDCERFVEFTKNGDEIFWRKYDEKVRVMKFADSDEVSSAENFTRIRDGKQFTAKNSFLSLLESKGIKSKKLVCLEILAHQ